MTPLERLLVAQIEAVGPLTVADYMSACLLHPQHGYYSTRDPLGSQGDFTTAPEISQMFGELIGLSLAQAWIDRGSPPRFQLIELGPGRGTLMADALRATAGVPGFHDAADISLIEASKALRARQQDALSGYEVSWHDTLPELPDTPLFVIANEFFDCLPIRQFIRSGIGWAERVIGVASGSLTFGLTEAAPLAALEHRRDLPEGTMVETCPSATALVGTIAAHIAAHGGAGLVIDYGAAPSEGDTFQAVKSHEKVPLLTTPGEADLTAHVDFAALSEAARAAGIEATLATQSAFLETLGITARASRLAQAATGPLRNDIVAAHRRLTHPDAMGSLFKVMALHQGGAAPPPGVAP